MRRSTSIHNFNADNENLNKFYKIINLSFYLLFNWINNLFPYTNIDNNLVIRNFICRDFKKYWNKLSIKSSPSRKLSDLFWLKLPWNKIYKELKEINIFDIGCGSGNYGYKLLNFSNNKIASYTGIDIYQDNNWEKLEKKYSNFRFYKYNGKNILDVIPGKANFIMSQSVLEHIEGDLILFKQIKDHVLSYKKSVIQIHLFPSSSCLLTYPKHGIRQYTPRTISKITRLFKNFSHSVLFSLGGKECNRLHYKFITKPRLRQKIGDLRDLKIQEYDKKLIIAIEKDMKLFQKFPSFYALVIHSNWDKKYLTIF